MTLIELRNRLNQIIEEHENKGWNERNNQEVICSCKVSKRKTEYRKLTHTYSGSLGLNDDQWYTQIKLEDEPYARY